jgi:antitoxin MazE
LIEQAGLTEEVELEVRQGEIVISPVETVRNGWAEAAQALSSGPEKGLLDEPIVTRFDEEEWE